LATAEAMALAKAAAATLAEAMENACSCARTEFARGNKGALFENAQERKRVLDVSGG